MFLSFEYFHDSLIVHGTQSVVLYTILSPCLLTMAAPNREACDALPLQATALENVAEPALGDGRPRTDETAFPSAQQQNMVQETCCQFRKFWRQQVSATVDHEACRDHLGMCVRLHFLCSACYWALQTGKRIPPLVKIGRLCIAPWAPHFPLARQ